MKEEDQKVTVNLLVGAILKYAQLDFDFVLPEKINSSELNLLATGIKMLGEELKDSVVSKTYLNNIFSSMVNTVVVVGTDGKIQKSNRALHELLGYQENELVGHSYSSLFPESRRTKQGIQIVGGGAGRLEIPVETTYLSKTKKPVAVRLFRSALTSINNELEGFVIVGEDLTASNMISGLIEEERKQSVINIVNTQESEKRRISRDLHDGIGQMLLATKLKISGFKHDEMKRDISEQLDSVVADVEAIIAEVRNMSNNLMPGILQDFGLSSALEILGDRYSNDVRLQVLVEVDKHLPRLDEHVEIAIYRISQEALTNAIKHGKADKIQIRLLKRADRIDLIIDDNGVGMDSRVMLKNRPTFGSGLRNMRDRVELFDGKLEINSILEKGTTIFVRIPLNIK